MILKRQKSKVPHACRRQSHLETKEKGMNGDSLSHSKSNRNICAAETSCAYILIIGIMHLLHLLNYYVIVQHLRKYTQ